MFLKVIEGNWGVGEKKIVCRGSFSGAEAFVELGPSFPKQRKRGHRYMQRKEPRSRLDKPMEQKKGVDWAARGKETSLKGGSG